MSVLHYEAEEFTAGDIVAFSQHRAAKELTPEAVAQMLLMSPAQQELARRKYVLRDLVRQLDSLLPIGRRYSDIQALAGQLLDDAPEATYRVTVSVNVVE